MAYPRIPDYRQLVNQIELYAQLKHERGSKRLAPILKKARISLNEALAELKRLPEDIELALREPDALNAIQELRPTGPRRIWKSIDHGVYRDRLEGALLGRFAGCTLGAPVEFWSIEKMRALANELGDEFPPTDYWAYVPEPEKKRYQVAPNRTYTRGNIDAVPVDDDIAYTILGLLIAEEYGPNFSTDDVGKAWLKYLPCACTAEEVALTNLKARIPPRRAADIENPFCEWIGAGIRSDPWGYMAPGWPERAAEMACSDAAISHRRQGIYGEMLFSAAVAAAFALDDPMEAIEIGLTEIPRSCALAKAVRWALRTAPDVRTYEDAHQAALDRFEGMSGVHTMNNACLTIFGLSIGGRDFTKVIGETVAMGFDNDCTAATAGSIVGAIVGKKGIPEHWYKSFNNTVNSYLISRKRFTISGLARRFEKQARRVYAPTGSRASFPLRKVAPSPRFSSHA